MTFPHGRRVLLISILLFAAQVSLRAAEDLNYSGDDEASSVLAGTSGGNPTRNNKHWEIGTDFGLATPIGNKSVTILADNSAFLISDPAVPGEDEFAENGIPSPDFAAKTTVLGEINPMVVIGGHGFYRVAPWVALGVEGFFQIQRSAAIKSAGPFQSSIYQVDFKAHGAQIAPVIRLGDWIGNVRPYALAGAGPYYYYQRITAELLDSDDAEHPPVIAGENSDTYLGAVWGGGVDFNFFNQGSVGLAVQYERVFKPGNNLQFFIPTLKFDYHF